MGLPPLETQICETFNYFFPSGFGVPLDKNTVAPIYPDNNDSIAKLSVNVGRVSFLLKSLNISNSAGSDGIPPVFWSKCANTLALPITILFLVPKAKLKITEALQY